ncbi:early nodulin-like protein 8 [Silene latifolia]|uniref:early nodulin-like protein 8 n=1 Tax=Silene latifolia TaxID=37657 RepID=UPI003D785865
MIKNCRQVVFLLAVQLLILQQAQVWCYQYKVGDLDAWGIPTAANPDVYIKWSKSHVFRVGDSLLFLYPPSQDSMIQVRPEAFKSCSLKDPILRMKDGNSVFNITQPGEFYFMSGEEGHCQKGQKLHMSLAGDGAIAYPPEGPGPLSDTSYTPAFGSIPTASSSSPLFLSLSTFLASLVGSLIWVLV